MFEDSDEDLVQPSRPQPSAELKAPSPTYVVVALQPLLTKTPENQRVNACVEGWARFGNICKGFWFRMEPLVSKKKNHITNLESRARKTHGLDPQFPWQVTPTEGEELLVGDPRRVVEWFQRLIDEATASSNTAQKITFLVPEEVEEQTRYCLGLCGFPEDTCVEVVRPRTSGHQCSYHEVRKNDSNKAFQCMRTYVAGRIDLLRLDEASTSGSSSDSDSEIQFHEDIGEGNGGVVCDDLVITTF